MPEARNSSSNDSLENSGAATKKIEKISIRPKIDTAKTSEFTKKVTSTPYQKKEVNKAYS